MNFCRCCRYYKPEGQRGGCCQLLDVPVKGGWRACNFAVSPFDCSFPTACEPHDRCEMGASADRWQRSTVKIPRNQPVLAGC